MRITKYFILIFIGLLLISCSNNKVSPITDFEYTVSFTNEVSIDKYIGNDKNVVIPEEIEGGKVTEIMPKAFMGNETIKSVFIPSSVKEIWWGAFINCEKLTEVKFGQNSQLNSIGNEAFHNTGFFRNAKDNTIVYVDKWVVGYKGNIEDVLLKDGTIGIGSWSFINNFDLKSIGIPNTVKYLNSPFLGCKNLESVTFEENSQLTNIGVYSFENCEKLKSITIPKEVTSIAFAAFRGCSGLEEVIFEADSKLTTLQDSVFINCSSLKNIRIPSSVVEILSSAFSNTVSLKEVIFEDNSSLKTIGSFAFENCVELNSINLDKALNLNEINWGAFSGCIKLLDLSIPSSVTTIAKEVFKDTAYVKNSVDNQVIILDNWVIGYKGNIKDVILPTSVVGISASAFEKSETLESVIMSDSILYLGEYAFYNCSNLKNVELSENISKISFKSFYGCESLESIIIPDNVLSIDNNAFSSCLELTQIDISKTSKLTSIGSEIVSACSKLETFYIPINVQFITSDAFLNADNLTIYAATSAVPYSWNSGWNPASRPVIWNYEK